MHYRSEDRPFYALAFKNDSGGFELRNPYFKGTLGRKDITTIAGDTQSVSLFEGFFDYLTAVMLNDGPLPETAIVLNSVSFKERAVEAIKRLGASQVTIYPDNDASGRLLLQYITDSLPTLQIDDKSESYAASDDLNAHYCRSLQRA